MKRVRIFNKNKMQLDVTGDDGNTYFIPPKTPTLLPAGVKVEGSLHKDLKILK